MKRNLTRYVLFCAGLMLSLASCKKDPIIEEQTALSSNELKSVTELSSASISNFIVGINGHSFTQVAYQNTSSSMQLAYLNDLGMNYYHTDIPVDAKGRIANEGKMIELSSAAIQKNIRLLPTLIPANLNYSQSESSAYELGKTIGSGFAAAYGQYFEYYELGNDLGGGSLKSGFGNNPKDYDPAKIKIVGAYLKGMDEGIKAKDSGAKTIVNSTWVRYGFLQALESYGVKFDVVGYTWYSDMDGAAKASFYKIDDITKKLSATFSKPIWFTAVNTKNGTYGVSEQAQADFLNSFIARAKTSTGVKAVLINELFDEPDRKDPNTEKSYGIIKWAKTYSQTELKIFAQGMAMAKPVALIRGINGHPMDPSPSPYASITPEAQMNILKDMGMNYYRFGIGLRANGDAGDKYTLRNVLNAATNTKVKILPYLQLPGLNLTSTEAAQYALGKAAGAGFASQYGQYFDMYELGNEQENHLITGGNVGSETSHYDEAKIKVLAAYLKGMDEGIKSKDPGAKTSTSASWLHYGYPKLLKSFGYNFDYVDWHWYSDMEGAAKAKYYRIEDITKTIAAQFPGMPIWFTEINQKTGTMTASEQDMDNFITSFTAKCQANPAVKAVLVYELLDEPQKMDDSGREKDYGVIKWITKYSQWEFKLAGRTLSAFK